MMKEDQCQQAKRRYLPVKPPPKRGQSERRVEMEGKKRPHENAINLFTYLNNLFATF